MIEKNFSNAAARVLHEDGQLFIAFMERPKRVARKASGIELYVPSDVSAELSGLKSGTVVCVSGLFQQAKQFPEGKITLKEAWALTDETKTHYGHTINHAKIMASSGSSWRRFPVNELSDTDLGTGVTEQEAAFTLCNDSEDNGKNIWSRLKSRVVLGEREPAFD